MLQAVRPKGVRAGAAAVVQASGDGGWCGRGPSVVGQTRGPGLSALLLHVSPLDFKTSSRKAEKGVSSCALVCARGARL